MTKANYATENNIKTLYTPITDSVSSSLLALSLTYSDNYIDSQYPDQNISKTATPALIMQAAEFKAMEFILRNLNDTSDGELPTADWYKKEADRLIESYGSSDEESLTNPYSSSKTPTNSYLRDTYDGDYTTIRLNRRKVINSDPETWTAED
jgi:hypothetical protein